MVQLIGLANRITLERLLRIQHRVEKIDNLAERYNEALLKTLKLLMKEHHSVMKKIKFHLEQIKVPLTIATHTY